MWCNPDWKNSKDWIRTRMEGIIHFLRTEAQQKKGRRGKGRSVGSALSVAFFWDQKFYEIFQGWEAWMSQGYGRVEIWANCSHPSGGLVGWHHRISERSPFFSGAYLFRTRNLDGQFFVPLLKVTISRTSLTSSLNNECQIRIWWKLDLLWLEPPLMDVENYLPINKKQVVDVSRPRFWEEA